MSGATNDPFLVPQLNGSFSAHIALPGSKSIALRQLAIAALAHGRTSIVGIPLCDDVDAMLDCITQLGVTVHREADVISVTGPMDYTSDVNLQTRMSGASTRLLLGLAALRQGRTTIDGHASLRVRTNEPLYAVLTAHGCDVDSSNGGLPVTVQGPLQPPTDLHIDGSLSSQYVTALLVAAPLFAAGAQQRICIDGDLVSRPYIDITLNEMAKRGVSARWSTDRVITVDKGHYAPDSVTVEGDASAATYFAALATLHASEVNLSNLGSSSKQGDYRFFEVMERVGARIERHPDSTKITGPAILSALPSVDMTDMPDAALTLMTLAPLLPGTTNITGLSSLHHKECDRLECPAAEMRDLGIQTRTSHDAISIDHIDPGGIQPHVLNTYHDHRMAMAFSLLGSVSGTLRVDDEQVVDKTYPNYWHDYATLRT
jgi:3-phosphoshikimate 1-carboxyvinyltransferase